VADDTPLCLLLLAGVLEDLPYAERLRELLRAPGVVAVEPARVNRRATGDMVAATQARRLTKKLPGQPRVTVVFHPAQYLLARALIGRNRECELWYGPADGAYDTDRLRELDLLARERAELEFSPHAQNGLPAFQQNTDLWDRLEQLRIARR
jgi:hypothetical protein